MKHALQVSPFHNMNHLQPFKDINYQKSLHKTEIEYYSFYHLCEFQQVSELLNNLFCIG